MLVDHLEIKKIGKNDYVINNTITNRYVKIGIRELNYLLYLKKLDPIDSEKEIGTTLDENQKTILHTKFEEWQFLGEAKVQKKRRDFSNIILFSFNSSSRSFETIMDKIKVVISPLGVALLFVSIVYFLYAISFETEATLYGMSNFTINVPNLIYIYSMNFFMGVLHEFCHATACYKYSGKSGTIGIKLFYLFPAYFCDVSNMHMVGSRKKTFIVSVAGLVSNVVVGNLVLFIYIFLYKHQIKCPILLYFFLSNLFTIFLNLNPLAKFDGYWIIKSVSGIDNLYDKSIVLFFTLILNIRKYSEIRISLLKKCLLTIYGMVIFLFHWFFWIFSIYIISNFTLDVLNMNIRIVVTLALIILGLINGIKLTLKYSNLYKINTYVY